MSVGSVTDGQARDAVPAGDAENVGEGCRGVGQGVQLVDWGG